MARTIKVGRDFSRFPAGRYRTDGKYSGEVFRQQFLEPYLRKGENIIVDLAGAEGYGSSFLDEAFGGLVRVKDIPKDNIYRCLEIVSSDPDLQTFVEDAKQYLDEALALR